MRTAAVVIALELLGSLLGLLLKVPETARGNQQMTTEPPVLEKPLLNDDEWQSV